MSITSLCLYEYYTLLFVVIICELIIDNHVVLNNIVQKSILHNNMAASNRFGRYICHLKRLTFNFCPVGGSSKGMR